MNRPDIEPTLEDFEKLPWNEIAKEVEKPEIYGFHKVFMDKARESALNGEINSQAAYFLLSDLSSMMLDNTEFASPFKPMVIFRDGRSTIIDDFSENNLEVIENLVEKATSPILKARLADIIWVRKRNHIMANIAIDSYLEQVQVSDNLEHLQIIVIERALNIAKEIRNKEKAELITQIINQLLQTSKLSDKFRIISLMDLLYKFRLGDASQMAEFSENFAGKFEAENDFPLAWEFWDFSAKWYSTKRELENERRCKIHSAEACIKYAQQLIGEDNYLSATKYFSDAFERYKKISDTKERRAEIHSILLECQVRTHEFMQKTSYEINLSEYSAQIEDLVSGKNLNEALKILALGISLPDFTKTREYILEGINKHPIMYLMGAEYSDSKGRAIARRSALLSNSNQSEIEEGIQLEVYKEIAEREMAVTAFGFIEPCRNIIALEHYLSLNELLFIVQNSHFIPQENQYTFLRGLLAGFKGDYLVAVSLLVPQVENSLRKILTEIGENTSKINKNGLQEDKNINELFSEHKENLIEILTENMYHSLRCVLTEKVGFNIRHDLAHGKLTDNSYSSTQAIYSWWLIYRICYLGFLIRTRNK